MQKAMPTTDEDKLVAQAQAGEKNKGPTQGREVSSPPAHLEREGQREQSAKDLQNELCIV